MMNDDCSIKCVVSQNISLTLKGLFSILVIICHVRGEIDTLNGILIGKILTQFGYLAVSIFFFLSGYGIWKRSKESSHYLTTFLKNRVLSLYLQYVLVVFFYTILFLIRDRSVDLLLFLQSFLFGKTIVPYGWYFQTITVFYLVFYLACRVLKQKMRICGIAGALGLYTLVCILCKLPTTWYETSFAFLIGILLVENEEKVECISHRQVIERCMGLFPLTVIAILLGTYKNLGILAVFFKMNSAVLFCLVVYYIAVVCSKIDNSIVAIFLKKLGKVSLEIYALQGFVILFVMKPLIGSDNPILFFILSIGFVICCAMIVHPVFKMIRKVVQEPRSQR